MKEFPPWVLAGSAVGNMDAEGPAVGERGFGELGEMLHLDRAGRRVVAKDRLVLQGTHAATADIAEQFDGVQVVRRTIALPKPSVEQ